MFDDVGNGAVLHEHERRRSLEQLSIGKLPEVLHASCLPCCFSSPTVTRGQRFSVSMSFEGVCQLEAWLDVVVARTRHTLGASAELVGTEVV
jgi:hypothetical protein